MIDNAENPQVHDESGAVLVETGLVLPLLVLLLFGIVDLTRVLSAYFMANRVIYEGARFASSLPGLERGTFAADCTRWVVEGLPDSYRCGTEGNSIHDQLQAHVGDLLNANGLQKATSIRLETTLESPTGVNIEDFPTDSNFITVIAVLAVPLTLPLRPIFPEEFSIRVKASSPYLYRVKD